MTSVPALNSPSGFRSSLFEWPALAQLLRPAHRTPMSQLASLEQITLDAPCPLTMPRLDHLPGDAASLGEIGGFIAQFDPTRHFREQWGERYRTKLEALWTNCVSAYRGSRDTTESAGELALCLAYDWRLGPYLGVAEHEKLAFLRWLVAQIRSRLSLPTSHV